MPARADADALAKAVEAPARMPPLLPTQSKDARELAPGAQDALAPPSNCAARPRGGEHGRRDEAAKVRTVTDASKTIPRQSPPSSVKTFRLRADPTAGRARWKPSSRESGHAPEPRPQETASPIIGATLETFRRQFGVLADSHHRVQGVRNTAQRPAQGSRKRSDESARVCATVHRERARRA